MLKEFFKFALGDVYGIQNAIYFCLYRAILKSYLELLKCLFS